jgi:hypothetical protein
VREVIAVYPRLLGLAKQANHLGELAVHAPPRRARLLLQEKTAADIEIASTLYKLGSSVLDAIKSSKNSDVLKLLAGGGAAGLGMGLGLAVPAAVAADRMSDRAEEGVKKYVTPAAAAVGALLAGKMLTSGSDSSDSEKVSSLCAALELNNKLQNTSHGVKTAESADYLYKVAAVSAAHVSDLVHDLIG